MLQVLKFDVNSKGPYRVGILIKNQALRQRELEQYYTLPFMDRGLQRSDIVAISLEYNDKNKAPVTLIKAHLETVQKVVEKLGISHLLVADAAYYKTLCKVRKAEPFFGYLQPTIWPGVQAAITVNWSQLFHNPSLSSKLNLGIEAIGRELQGKKGMFEKDIIYDAQYPQGLQEIQNSLDTVFDKPALTLDVETVGLHLKRGKIMSLALGSDQHSGLAFKTRTQLRGNEIYWFQRALLIEDFLREYKGKLIFHNAPFDAGRLIYHVFMKDHDDMKGMLEGLHTIFRNVDCTQVLTYLATNSASGNKLSLKEQAFEFAGNYGLDNIADVTHIEDRELLKYNLTDCLATWYTYNKHRHTVRQTQENTYQEVFRPALKTITQMELCGMPFCNETVKETALELKTIKDTHLEKLSRMSIVKHYEIKHRLQMALDATSKLKVKVKTAADFQEETFNFRSNKQVAEILYDQLNLPVFRYTDTKQPSVDSKAIDGLIEHIKKNYL